MGFVVVLFFKSWVEGTSTLQEQLGNFLPTRLSAETSSVFLHLLPQGNQDRPPRWLTSHHQDCLGQARDSAVGGGDIGTVTREFVNTLPPQHHGWEKPSHVGKYVTEGDQALKPLSPVPAQPLPGCSTVGKVATSLCLRKME